MPIGRVVVVIPAHNEVAELSRCVASVQVAAERLPLPVLIVVVLDACEDGSEFLAMRFGHDADVIDVDARNVGAARAAGFAHARTVNEGRDSDEVSTWYATTDADSRVDPDWLTRQIDTDADMVLGVVRVASWRHVPTAAMNRYLAAYRAKSGGRGAGHGHVHGANMGFRADIYWKLGGFAPLSTGEDVDLVRRFEEDGRRIARDPTLSVVTSARSQGRAPRGFAGYLHSMTRGEGVA